MLRFIKYAFAAVGAAVVIGIAALWGFDIYYRPYYVANMLELDALPKSVKVVDCGSPFIATDVLLTCSIEVVPEEFDALLAGYDFDHDQIETSSHSVGSSKVGPNFVVTNRYQFWLDHLQYGGAVQVFASSNLDKAVVDLYIE